MSYTTIQPNLFSIRLSVGNPSAEIRTRLCNPKSLARSLSFCRPSHFNQLQASLSFGGGRKRQRTLRATASSLELPLLPFNINEILIPTESKTLHLYEARYLALLEESLQRKKNLFVHFVLEPVAISKSATEASFAAKYGCLVLIESIKRLDVGALVSIRGIGRVTISKFLQADPYLVGEIQPLNDASLSSASGLASKITLVKESIHRLNSLEIKLKVPKEGLLQTRMMNSLTWAESEPSLELDQEFFPSSAERISFAAFQPISGSSESELSRLQQTKVRVMNLQDTIKRLDCSAELLKENISMVAAKLAIQSVEMS